MANFFESRWAEKECDLGVPTDIRVEMVAFKDVLLPSEAAPFLSFGDASGQKHIFEIFGFPEQWSDTERERLSEYVVLGSDGSGNPICERDSDKAIVLVDHDDGFNTVQFVNSSVQQLQESLLAYFGERDQALFRSVMLQIDPKAIEPESFWYFEANGIGEDYT